MYICIYIYVYVYTCLHISIMCIYISMCAPPPRLCLNPPTLTVTGFGPAAARSFPRKSSVTSLDSAPSECAANTLFSVQG